MNVVRAFADYLHSVGIATLGTDLFISRAPSSNKTGDRIFWLKANGGNQDARSVNGSTTQNYIIEVYHRDVSTEGVYETLQELGEDLACAGCLTLASYDVIQAVINGPWTDQDLDDEERTVGLMQVTITVRQGCEISIS